LCLHPDTPVETVDGIADGLDACARRWGVALAGGDLSSATEMVVSVSLIGSASRGQEVRRSGAQIGDALYVTGHLGGAAAGLAGLQAGIAPEDETWAGLIARQLRPEPRVEEGERARMAGASAMIDISDGLAVDLAHLIDASGVGCDVDPALLPVDPGLTAVDLPEVTADPTTLAIIGGEDFELLFAIDERLEEPLRRSFESLGTNLTRIGAVTDGDALIGDEALDTWRKRGWEHLRTR
jgi:thiamine-monophosphate kinase